MKTDYLPAVQSAIKFIEAHLNEEISIQEVASQSGFSQYHFHRIFNAVVGESGKDYIRSRRLAIAADELLQSDTSVLELALRSGFESQEAFTRAFKKMFRTTPGAYRKNGQPVSAIRKPEATSELLLHIQGGITMQPTIVTRPGEAAIGMGDSFIQGQSVEISELWMRFVPRMHEIKHRRSYDLGLCMSVHPQIQMKAGDKFVYVAAVPVEKVDEIPEGMVLCEIPEATYARFTHKGPILDIKHTVEYIWGTWVPQSGYELRDTPDFELYDERFDPKTGTGEVDIYVPIKT
jgi:AraC family transcriptional regulator